MSATPSPEMITALEPNQVFVYGSNRAGIHGKGAAKTALKWGAIMRQSGFNGQTYGIDTKDRNIQTLPLSAIQINVERFLRFAATHPDLEFLVTPIGTGLAGLNAKDIAPFFSDALAFQNVRLPQIFLKHLSA